MLTTIKVLLDSDWSDFFEYMNMNDFTIEKDIDGSFIVHGDQEVEFDVTHDQYGNIHNIQAYTNKKDYKNLSQEQFEMIESIVSEKLSEAGNFELSYEEHITY